MVRNYELEVLYENRTLCTCCGQDPNSQAGMVGSRGLRRAADSGHRLVHSSGRQGGDPCGPRLTRSSATPAGAQAAAVHRSTALLASPHPAITCASTGSSSPRSRFSTLPRQIRELGYEDSSNLLAATGQGQAGTCPDRMRAIACTVRAVTAEVELSSRGRPGLRRLGDGQCVASAWGSRGVRWRTRWRAA